MPTGPACQRPPPSIASSLSLLLPHTPAAATGPRLAPVMLVSHVHSRCYVAHGRRPPLFTWQLRHARPPSPPSPTSTQTRPRQPLPFFPSLSRATEPLFKTNAGRRPVPVSSLLLSSMPKTPEPRAAFLSRHSCSSPEHRDPIIRRDLVGAAALLPFLGVPPSEPLLYKFMTLTHLSLSLQPAGCVADHRGPLEATIVVGAPPSRSSSSASTSPTRPGGFPLSLGCPAHSPCNTAALGIGPTGSRAPAHRW
jgi:hypothetical protein